MSRTGRRRIFVALVCIVLGSLLVWRTQQAPVARPLEPAPAAAGAQGQPAVAPDAPTATPTPLIQPGDNGPAAVVSRSLREISYPPGVPSGAGGTGVTGLTPQEFAAVDAELESVQTAVRQFRTELGENPIGTNAEITRSILGDNAKQVKIALPPGSQLNGSGELCDRWGTPYFFHQMSHDRMEIRSAGTDRRMWTDDDLELK